MLSTMIALQLRFNAMRSWSAVSSINRGLATTASFSRVSAPSGTIALPLTNRRSLTTQHASRPKAHTGRTTSTPRKKKAPASVGDGETTEPKPEAKAKAKGTAEAKAKPKTKAKAKAKPKAKRAVTEEAKAIAAERKQVKHLRELKRTALRAPKKLPESVYSLVATELAREAKGIAGAAASTKYKSLSPHEMEHYNHIKTQNKRSNEEVLTAWIESLSPEDIRKANLARRQLKTMGIKPTRPQIKDDRQVKRPATAHALFLKDRYASGDMEHVKATDGMGLVMQEWKELPESEKSAYVEMAAAEKLRYASELKSVYGMETTVAAPAA